MSNVDIGERSYYYIKEWRDKLVDSRDFYRSGHDNPKTIPLATKIFVAEHAYIDQIEIGDSVKKNINNFLDVTSDTRPDDSSVKMHSGLYCIVGNHLSAEQNYFRNVLS